MKMPQLFLYFAFVLFLPDRRRVFPLHLRHTLVLVWRRKKRKKKEKQGTVLSTRWGMSFSLRALRHSRYYQLPDAKKK